MGVAIYPGKGGVNVEEPQRVHDFGDDIPAATDRDGICQAQQTGGAGALTLNGAGVSGGLYSAGFDGGRKITVYSAGNLSARTFTVTGTDWTGAAQSEEITGPNATTATGTKYFQTVTGVSVDGAVGTDVEVGFAASLVVCNLARGKQFRLDPTNNETVLIALYGAAGEGLRDMVGLRIEVPASLTAAWANGTTVPADQRVYFAGGTEPTLTASGVDHFLFIADGWQVSGDTVWYCAAQAQDLKP